MKPAQPKIYSDRVELEIDRFPPQSNNCYSQTKQGRRFPTKELVGFKAAVAAIELWHPDFIAAARKQVAEWLSSGQVLKVERVFLFPREKIFTKAGKIKVCDLSNRIKAVDDSVSNLLNFDDSLIFWGCEEKMADHSDGLGRVWISISPISP